MPNNDNKKDMKQLFNQAKSEIIQLLKDFPNGWIKLTDITTNILGEFGRPKPSTRRTVAELARKLKYIKKRYPTGKIPKGERQQYGYFGKESPFRLWRISFKLVQTSSLKPQQKWDAAMNLEAYADGIVSNKYTKQDVLNVVASPFFSAILDTLADDNPPIILYTALNPERDVFIDVSVLNETPLDTRYEAEWKGKIFFTNNLGKLYTFPLFFKIRQSAWT